MHKCVVYVCYTTNNENNIDQKAKLHIECNIAKISGETERVWERGMRTNWLTGWLAGWLAGWVSEWVKSKRPSHQKITPCQFASLMKKGCHSTACCSIQLEMMIRQAFLFPQYLVVVFFSAAFSRLLAISAHPHNSHSYRVHPLSIHHSIRPYIHQIYTIFVNIFHTF